MMIVITGSESTGKTEIARGLAAHFAAPWIAEYARAYIEELDRSYVFSDVENIARHQILQIGKFLEYPLFFMDTGLVITKVWFERKFGMAPHWFQQQFDQLARANYLICSPDLDWVPDPVRENPHLRDELDRQYQMEIEKLGCPIHRIEGYGEIRLERAIRQVNLWIKNDS